MPPAAASEHVDGSRKANWWQATKLACGDQVGARIGRGPKRRCETVTEPDFFES